MRCHVQGGSGDSWDSTRCGGLGVPWCRCVSGLPVFPSGVLELWKLKPLWELSGGKTRAALPGQGREWGDVRCPRATRGAGLGAGCEQSGAAEHGPVQGPTESSGCRGQRQSDCSGKPHWAGGSERGFGCAGVWGWEPLPTTSCGKHVLIVTLPKCSGEGSAPVLRLR